MRFEGSFAAHAPVIGWRRGHRIGGSRKGGGGGQVYQAVDDSGERVFAVKTLSVRDVRRAHSEEAGDEGPICIEGLEAELARWKDLSHPNVVNILGHECTAQQLHVFLTYMPAGSMASFLQEFGPLREQPLRRATQGVLEGLAYLHSREPPLAHGNLKGENILIGCDFTVRLTDFGYRLLPSRPPDCLGRGAGLQWTAPEVAQQRATDGLKADVWGLGCGVLEMATATAPWGSKTSQGSVRAVLLDADAGAVPPMPPALDQQAQDLASCCLQRAPSQRPSAAELLTHAFLTGHAAEADR